MFYVSPRADQSTPVFDSLFNLIPPVAFIVLYFVVLTLVSAGIMYAVRKLTELSDRRKTEGRAE
jgi:hypothetical protein